MTDNKPIRSESLYVSYAVRKALTYLAQAQTDQLPDVIANDVLAKWLTDTHPDIMAHIEAQRQIDKEFRLALQKKLSPTPF